MKLLKLQKIIPTIKNYPYQETAQSFKFLPGVFSRLEKVILLASFAALIGLTGLIGYNRWVNSTVVVAQSGGTFREGIVGESKDLDKHLSRLINAGLTKYDSNKSIVGDMADSWEINESGKVYVFHLNSQFDSGELASQIEAKNLWKDIEIATPDANTITFTFKQPFSPFLYTSTEPIFDAGPYRISRESKDEVELLARSDYFGGKPYIEKLVFKFYPNEDSLLKGVKRGEVDGVATNSDVVTDDDFVKYEMKMPRQLLIFFNLSRKDLQDINIRKALKENTALPKSLELRLVTSDNPQNVEIAKNIVDKWGKNQVKVNLDIRDNVSLQKDIIPKRDYDVLLYGLDYGEDPDPYPFWHSSQINETGRNLSNFKNAKGDKLLEEARQQFDFAKREQNYLEFQKVLDQEIPAFVVQDETMYYQISKKVKGVDKIVGALETDRFLNISKWYINTKRVKK